MTTVGENRREWVFDETDLEDKIGYSRAVITGPWVHVAGTTGLDYNTMELPGGAVEQADQCLRNIGHALARAGATWEDVVLVRYIFANRDDFSRCWALFRERFHDIRPAATMFVAELATPQTLVEMEVIACKGSTGSDHTSPHHPATLEQ